MVWLLRRSGKRSRVLREFDGFFSIHQYCKLNNYTNNGPLN